MPVACPGRSGLRRLKSARAAPIYAPVILCNACASVASARRFARHVVAKTAKPCHSRPPCTFVRPQCGGEKVHGGRLWHGERACTHQHATSRFHCVVCVRDERLRHPLPPHAAPLPVASRDRAALAVAVSPWRAKHVLARVVPFSTRMGRVGAARCGALIWAHCMGDFSSESWMGGAAPLPDTPAPQRRAGSCQHT